MDKLFDNYHVSVVRTLSCLLWSETHSGIKVTLMEARSGQNLDNKIALQVSFNPTAADIMDLSHIFVINKQYLFQRVSNYFLQHELFVLFFFNYTNTFFIHTMNYFSVVLRTIFLMCIENYFFIRRKIIFRGIANLFLGLQCFAGLAVGVDWVESF